MEINVGINGFGRIGSMAMRAALKRPDINLVGINDPFLSSDAMVYFLKYDSVHGRSDDEIIPHRDAIEIRRSGQDALMVPVYNEKDPASIPWGKVGGNYILECTGKFLTSESAVGHLKSGANYVVMSAPSKDSVPMFVMGVNQETYQGQSIVSNASCTTNCLAPVAKVLHELAGIEAGLMTTVHAITASQKVTDSLTPSDWRLGRAAFQNIIPASTGAAKAVGKVLPALDGKLTGMAFRVPTQDVSVVDLTCQLERSTDINAIRECMKEKSKGELAGILGYTDEALVSTDFIGESCTSVFDAGASLCLTPTFVKIIAWYDNEWAYANKLLDLAAHMSKHNSN